MPKLILKRGDFIVKKLFVPPDILAFTVGSEQGNDIIINDDLISFFHLQFEKQGGGYYVRDLQSERGTFVNGARIPARTRLKSYDEIGLGRHSITFIDGENKPLPAVEAERLRLEHASADASIEEKLAGAPTLNRLNAWLHNEANGTKQRENHQELVAETPDFITDDSEFFSEQRNGADTQAANSETFLHQDDAPADARSENEPIVGKTNGYLGPNMDAEPEPILRNTAKSETPTTGRKVVEAAPSTDYEIEKPATTHYLLGIHGYYLGRRFRVKHPETKIGRDPKLNHIVIRKNSRSEIDQSVSRRQAVISFKNGKYVISDRRSKSRTRVNQKELSTDETVEIRPGDEIEIASEGKSHILRFVREGDWDFSFPRKAGSWTLRHRLVLLNAYSAALVLIAALFLFRSLTSVLVLTRHPDPLRLSQETWVETGSPLAASGKRPQVRTPDAALADFNGDHRLDLAFVDGAGFLNCVDGASRRPLWPNVEFLAAENNPIAVADFFGDGRPDIAVITADSRITVVDGQLGLEVWRSPILAGPLVGPPVVADLNGDGQKDVAVTSEQNVLYIGFATPESPRWVKVEIGSDVRSIPTAAALGGNDDMTVLLGTETGKLLFINGKQARLNGSLNVGEELSKATGRFEQNNPLRAPVAVGDLNGDARQDLVVATATGKLITFNGLTLERLWYASSSGVTQAETAAPVLADLDSDGLLDVVWHAPDGNLMAFKGTGQGKDRNMLLWQHQVPGGTDPVVADFDKDGTWDVAVAGSNGTIEVFAGATGERLWQGKGGSTPTSGLLLLGDLNADRRLDLLVPETDGKFTRLSTNSPISKAAILWGQAYGNGEHTGRSGFQPEDMSVYYGYTGASLLLILMTAGLQFFVRRKRSKLV